MISVAEIKDKYPLHWLVWNNQHDDLQEVLQCKQVPGVTTNKQTPKTHGNTNTHITLLMLIELIEDIIVHKMPYTIYMEIGSGGCAGSIKRYISLRFAVRLKCLRAVFSTQLDHLRK